MATITLKSVRLPVTSSIVLGNEQHGAVALVTEEDGDVTRMILVPYDCLNRLWGIEVATADLISVEHVVTFDASSSFTVT